MLRHFVLVVCCYFCIAGHVDAADSLWNPFAADESEVTRVNTDTDSTFLTFPDFDLIPKLPKPSLDVRQPISRLQAGTKQFFGKAKDVLTPPKLTLPDWSFPSPFADDDRTQRSSDERTSLFGSWFFDEPEPPRPMTVSDFIGQPRPE